MFKLLKTLLKQPVKETLIIFIIALISFGILLTIGALVGRFEARDYIAGADENYFLLITKTVVWWLVSIANLVLRLTSLILVAQVVYRLKNK